MRHALEYVGGLVHLVGMLLFIGGHLWFSVMTTLVERQQDSAGARFLAQHLPHMANVFGAGVLLLFASGMLRLVVWNEPGLLFLPDPYGWILLSKLLLYMGIVLNGAWIERRYLPQVLRAVPTPDGACTMLQLTPAWTQLKLRARLNLLLLLVAVALGEALRYARA